MPKIPCAGCGERYAEGKLLYTEAGQICVDCESKLEERAARAGQLRSLMLSGPVLAVASLVWLAGSMAPVIGVGLLWMTPLLGIFGAAQGVRTLLASRRDADLTTGQQVALLVSGGISTFWCVGVAVVAAGQLVVRALSLGAGAG